MKKTLLIILIVFCIFQMIVMATAIDVGNPAINCPDSRSQNYTIIIKDNPANATGTITTVKIWSDTNLAGCEVGTFEQVSALHFTCRDYETVNNGSGAGVVTSGSEQTFTVDLDVEAGDYIGMYWTSGDMEYDRSTGDGYWYLAGDQVPCTDATYVLSTPRLVSIGGTGATAEEEAEDNAILFGINF